jgi:hypothetical protein
MIRWFGYRKFRGSDNRISGSEGFAHTDRRVGLLGRFPWIKVAAVHFVLWCVLSPLLRELLVPESAIDAQGPVIVQAVLLLIEFLAMVSFPVTWILDIWFRIMPLAGDMGAWPPNGFATFCLLIPVNSVVFGVAVWYGIRFLKYTLHPKHW